MKTVNRRWFSMKSDEDAKTAEVAIFDYIDDFGVTVADFKKELDAIKDAKAITLLINSGGGDVFAGMSIYNLLLPLREKITVRIIGLAASVASVIAQAGKDAPTMIEGTFYMIHNAWTIALGDSKELRKTADLLETIDAQIANVYVKRLGEDKRAAVMAQMDAETWFTAEEAQAAGFAASVEEAEQMAALADLSKFQYRHIPAAVAARVKTEAHPPTTLRDFEALLREQGGFSRKAAEAIAKKGFSAVQPGGVDDQGSGELAAAEPPKGIALSDEKRRALEMKLRLALAN